MLKFERNRHTSTGDAPLHMKSKEPLFTGRLCRSLTFALCLHIAAVIFFRLQTTQPFIPPPPPSTVVVETALENVEIEIASPALSTPSSEPGGIAHLPSYVAEPYSPKPRYPTMPNREINRVPSDKETIFPDDAFSSKKRRAYDPHYSTFTFAKQYTPVRLHISGALATLRLEKDALKKINKTLKKQSALKRSSAKFRTQLDGTKGEIFWFEKIESTGHPHLDEIAEGILKELTFKTGPHAFFVDGEVHVMFTVPESDSYDYLLTHESVIEKFHKELSQ